MTIDFDLIAIIIYVTFGVVWILSILRCLYHRHLSTEVEKARMAPSEDNDLPQFSVIITSHDQCDELRRNLPLILNQIYPTFEVLVVDMNSTDDTKKLLEQLEEEHTNLRHTFTPATSRDISLQRLAITLGVKASTYPWLVITQADCCPISHLWLRRFGDTIKGHRSAEIAIGYTRFAHIKGYTEQRMCFYRLWTQISNLMYAPKHGAYHSDGTNLVYKKELFLSHQGFASHANLLAGATDIMVNQHSTQHNTAICLHPEAILQQQMPTHKHWNQDRLYFQESRKYFTHRLFFQLRSFCSMLLHALLVVCLLATIGIAIWNEQYIIAGVALLLEIIHITVQGICFNATAKALNNHAYNYLRTAWFIHLLPFWSLRIWLQHTFGNKQKFRKKYI